MANQGIVRNGMKSIFYSGRTQSSISVPTATRFVNTVTLQLNDSGTLLIAKIYRSLFLDSITGLNWMNQGANVDPSLYDVYTEDGGFYTLDPTGAILTPMTPNLDQSQVFVNNRSGSTHSFIVVAGVRYIVNDGSSGVLTI